MGNRKIYIASFVLVAGLVLVYSNHFQNTFHFDDSHTVTNNVYVQDIKNIPRFFQDASTFSSLPSNQSYRPVVTTTLAVDYFLGKGLNPFYFHLSTFILFILQGILMYFLFRKAAGGPASVETASMISLLAAALYLFHPAIAETVNYIIARSDSLSTLFVVLAFVLYLYSPVCRKYHLYLLPVAIGALAKIPAIMFAPLLFVYILLFEKQIPFLEWFNKKNIPHFVSAIKATLPAFLVSAALYFFVQKMETTWVAGGTSPYLYFITQPYVIFHYVKTFFVPTGLSADTDWVPFTSVLELRAIFGFLFCAWVLFLAVITSRTARWRPVSFGLWWFFIALIPSSSVIALSEVMNDHRIFFPYVGLSLAVVWTVYLVFERIKIPRLVIVVVCSLVLSAYGYGTHQRNKVWHSDESLWKDVTEKSPNNPRGLMNYGLALMKRMDYAGAEDYFKRGLKIWPQYAYLHINMGVLKAAIGQVQEAEQYFLNAITYRNDLPESYYYYGEFLYRQNRAGEALQMLNKTLELAPGHVLAKELMGVVYPAAAETPEVKLSRAIAAAEKDPTPETYLTLSLEYYHAGKYEDCIHAAEESLKLKPDYDLAYNNICSAYNMLGNWEKAIEAGEKAVQLNPNNQLAKNNLEWAKKQKGK